MTSPPISARWERSSTGGLEPRKGDPNIPSTVAAVPLLSMGTSVQFKESVSNALSFAFENTLETFGYLSKIMQ